MTLDLLYHTLERLGLFLLFVLQLRLHLDKGSMAKIIKIIFILFLLKVS